MRILSLVIVVLAASALGAPKQKVKGKAAPPPVVEQPAPVVPADPTPVIAPPPPPPSPVAQTPVAPPIVSEPLAAPVNDVKRSGLVLQANGGAVMPFSVLGVGGRGELRVSWVLDAPLALSLGFAFEQHTARTAARFAPPAGGFDAAALDNQTVFPIELLAHALLLRDEHQRLFLGGGYGLLTVWSAPQALGKLANESGVGHEFIVEGGYARRLTPTFELLVRARYSVRRTAVGTLTSQIELPWYQTAGVLVGVGLWL